MTTERFPIEKLVLSPEVQTRVRLNNDAVEEYAEAYRTQSESKVRLKGELPLVCVWKVGKTPYVVDGFHRVAGATMANLKSLGCEVVGTGTLEEARWKALEYNHKHGAKRTNEDKRRVAAIAVELHPEWSDAKLAEYCGVSDKTIASVRPKTSQLNRSGSSEPEDLSAGNDSCENYPTPADDRDDKDDGSDIDWGDESYDFAAAEPSKFSQEADLKIIAPERKPKERRQGKDGKMYPVKDGKSKATKAFKADRVLYDAGLSIRRAKAELVAIHKECLASQNPEFSHAISCLNHTINMLEKEAFLIMDKERVPCPICSGRVDEMPKCNDCASRRWVTRSREKELRGNIKKVRLGA